MNDINYNFDIVNFPLTKKIFDIMSFEGPLTSAFYLNSHNIRVMDWLEESNGQNVWLSFVTTTTILEKYLTHKLLFKDFISTNDELDIFQVDENLKITSHEKLPIEDFTCREPNYGCFSFDINQTDEGDIIKDWLANRKFLSMDQSKLNFSSVNINIETTNYNLNSVNKVRAA